MSTVGKLADPASTGLRYAVITPVRNEEAYIEETLRCMVAQTVKPVAWIIVNDGSTDNTAEIVSGYADQHAWITLLNREDRGFRQRGPGVVDAFYEGLGQIDRGRFDIVVKLDGDLSFEPAYFEELLQQFAGNPKLGIASGQVYGFNGERWATRRARYPSTHGPTKVYRKDCFEAIGGIRRSLGWDGIDDWHARMLGWEIAANEDLRVLHHRHDGAESGRLKGPVEQGRGAYYMGYHPLYMIARSARRMVKASDFFGGLAMMWGYLVAWFTGKGQVEPELVRFVHREQLQVLNSLIQSFFRDRLRIRGAPPPEIDSQ